MEIFSNSNMISQTVTDIWIYEISSAILIFNTIMIGVFSALSLIKYLERRTCVALFFTLSNLTWVAIITTSNIGVTDLIAHTEKTNVYGYSLIGMSVGIILVSLFLYQFYAEVSGQSKQNRVLSTIAAFAIIGIILLPINGWLDFTATGFQFKYISYLFQTVYCVGIFLILARGFNRLAKRLEDKTQARYFRFIVSGNLLLASFFVFMMIRAFVTSSSALLFVQISSWTLIALGISCLFYGYIVPMFTGVKDNQEENT